MITLGLTKHPVIDEIEDDLPKIRALSNTPMVEQGHRHWPVLIEGIVSNSNQQLTSGDMFTLFPRFVPKPFQSEVQGPAYEIVGLLAVARILLDNRIDNLREIPPVHNRIVKPNRRWTTRQSAVSAAPVVCPSVTK